MTEHIRFMYISAFSQFSFLVISSEQCIISLGCKDQSVP